MLLQLAHKVGAIGVGRAKHEDVETEGVEECGDSLEDKSLRQSVSEPTYSLKVFTTCLASACRPSNQHDPSQC